MIEGSSKANSFTVKKAEKGIIATAQSSCVDVCVCETDCREDFAGPLFPISQFGFLS